MLLTFPGMTLSLRILVARTFMTGWQHTQSICGTIFLQREPLGVTNAPESVRWMSGCSTRIWLIASHWNQFLCWDLTTSHFCVSVVKTIRWSVIILEGNPITQSGLPSLRQMHQRRNNLGVICRVPVKTCGDLP